MKDQPHRPIEDWGRLDRENILVRKVRNYGDGTRGEAVLFEDSMFHGVVHCNYLVAKCSTETLLPEQDPIRKTPILSFEFRHKRIRHWIVNIQNDLGAAQLWHKRTEYQEIRHIVDVDDAICIPHR